MLSFDSHVSVPVGRLTDLWDLLCDQALSGEESLTWLAELSGKRGSSCARTGGKIALPRGCKQLR